MPPNKLSITEQYTTHAKEMADILILSFKPKTVMSRTNPCKLRTHFFCLFYQVGFQHVFCTFGVDKSVCCVQCLSLIHPPCSFFYISSMLEKKNKSKLENTVIVDCHILLFDTSYNRIQGTNDSPQHTNPTLIYANHPYLLLNYSSTKSTSADV